MMAKKERSLEEPIWHAADAHEQPLGIDAQAFERSSTPCKNADKAEVAAYRASIQVFDPTSLTATFEKKRCSGSPLRVPR